MRTDFGSVSYSAQSTWFRTLRRSDNAQKSQPRNGCGEIFVPAVGETTRKTVSGVNLIARDAKKEPPNRAKSDVPKRLI